MIRSACGCPPGCVLTTSLPSPYYIHSCISPPNISLTILPKPVPHPPWEPNAQLMYISLFISLSAYIFIMSVCLHFWQFICLSAHVCLCLSLPLSRPLSRPLSLPTALSPSLSASLKWFRCRLVRQSLYMSACVLPVITCMYVCVSPSLPPYLPNYLPPTLTPSSSHSLPLFPSLYLSLPPPQIIYA